MCRSLFIEFGSEIFLRSGAPGWMDWVWYTGDHLARVLLFDTFEIYRWDISPIEHANSFWAASCIWVYRLALSIGFGQLILGLIKSRLSPAPKGAA